MNGQKIVRNVLLQKNLQQRRFPLALMTSSHDMSMRNTKRYPKPLKTKKYGVDILKDSLWNKSLAFDLSERDRLGLRGLMPPAVRSIEDQVDRVLGNLRGCPDDVSKNLFLQDLHSRNETLYHRLLVDHVSFSSSTTVHFLGEPCNHWV